MERLFSARADGTYPQLMNQYINTELLILDEIGFQRIDTENVNISLRLSGGGMNTIP